MYNDPWTNLGQGAWDVAGQRGGTGQTRAGRRAGADPLPGAEELQEIGAGRVAPVYIVHGPDRYLREEMETALRGAVLAPGWESLNYQVLDGDAVSLDQMVEMAAAPPWGGGGRLLVVRGAPYFRDGASGRGRRRRGGAGDGAADGRTRGEAAFLGYLAAPSPTTCILFDADEEVDASHPLVQAVSACGKVVAARRPGRDGLTAWVAREAARLGKRVAPAVAARLVERCQEDRLLLCRELEKLACYAGERQEITFDDIRAVVGKSREESVFEMLDAVADRDAGRALALLDELLGRGEAPLGILALLARQVRLACHAAGLAEEGLGPDEIAVRLGQKPWVVRRLLRQGASLAESGFPAAFAALLEADLAIKNGSQQPELALAALCVQLSMA